MQLYRKRVCGAVALMLVLGGCSSSHSAGRAHTMTVARGVTVTVLAGGPKITAVAEPTATASLTAAVRVAGGSPTPSGLAVLAPAEKLVSAGPLPGGATLSFHVDPRTATQGSAPFLATLEPSGKWMPVAGSYDPRTGEVSARLPHFSIWAPIQWIASRVGDAVKGALSDVFGPIESGPDDPVCSASEAVSLSDDHPGHGIAACAQTDGSDRSTVKVLNRRPYPVDLLYPAGTTVDAPSSDIFAEIGGDLNNLSSRWHDRILLPGKTEADPAVPLRAGESAPLGTELDGEAYLTGILGTALEVLADMSGKLAITTGMVLEALAKGTCLRDLVGTMTATSLSASTAHDIGATGFECVSAASDSAGFVVASIAAIISSLAGELVSGVWGLVDTATGNANHTLTVQRAAPITVYLAGGQDAANPSKNRQYDYKPSMAQISGDSTYVIQVATWPTWSATSAVAVGTALIDNCEPDCADGHIYHVPVTATFTDPVDICGWYFWSRASFDYTAGPPPIATTNPWPFTGLSGEAGSWRQDPTICSGLNG